jgi:hypothetical protein
MRGYAAVSLVASKAGELSTGDASIVLCLLIADHAIIPTMGGAQVFPIASSWMLELAEL